MQFTLLYRGNLPSAGNPKDKHQIRLLLSEQLQELWRSEPRLAGWGGGDLERLHVGEMVNKEIKNVKRRRDGTAFSVSAPFWAVPVGGVTFVPLLSRMNNLLCHLEITFLRQGSPGSLIGHGGDIDNRIKTLFDSLRMPHEESEIGNVPSPGTVFCLLEDDTLITKVSVDTRRLLELPPAGTKHPASWASLQINVTTLSSRPENYVI